MGRARTNACGVRNRFGGTTNARAYPAGQTLGQTASFRQTAPETRCQSRVCDVRLLIYNQQWHPARASFSNTA